MIESLVERMVKAAVLFAFLAAGAAADAPEFPAVDLDQIAEADRAEVEAALADPTLVVPLDKEEVAASVEIYEFLLARLDLTSHIVRRFRLGEYEIEGMGPEAFHVDDGEGAVADVRLVHRGALADGKTRRLYHARGYFEILGDLRVYGDGLIALDYVADGEGRLRTEATVSFKVANDTIDRLSRLARRVLRIVVEKKAALFITAAKEASELVAKDAARVSRRLEGDDGVDADDLAAFRDAFERE